jgi:hypothetical protein
MKALRELDVNEMARVEGGMGDGYCGTTYPGQFFHPPHGGGGDPWQIKMVTSSQIQVNPVVTGGIMAGRVGAF